MRMALLPEPQEGRYFLALQFPLPVRIAAGCGISALRFAVDHRVDFSPSAYLIGACILVCRLRGDRIPVAGIGIYPRCPLVRWAAFIDAIEPVTIILVHFIANEVSQPGTHCRANQGTAGVVTNRLSDEGASRCAAKRPCLGFGGTGGKEEEKKQGNNTQIFHDLFPLGNESAIWPACSTYQFGG